MAQFLAAGPSVDMVNLVASLFGTPPTDPGYPDNLTKASYMFTGLSFVQGMSNLFYMPLIIKYGRRPVYILSFLVYGGCALWAGLATSYASELSARLMLGLAGGSAECLAPLTIADTFFLHERGLVMALYSASLSSGIAGGIIISGLITMKKSWRVIYYVATAFIWALVIAIFLTMPETSYRRFQKNDQLSVKPSGVSGSKEASSHVEISDSTVPPKKTYFQRLAIFSGTYTSESLWKLFWRPVPLLFLPPVFWATLAMSVVVGAFVAISSNFASSFALNYGWVSWQSGLSFVAVLLGSLVGIMGGGWLSDACADWLTKRNKGVREPEMRLPTLTLSMILGPLGLVLYGVGIQNRSHWIVPVLGLGIFAFALTQSTNILVVYVIDAYRPVAGEAVVAQLSFKAAFGFLLSFYVNPWVEKSGMLNTFGALAGINAAFFVMWIPTYYLGKKIRHASLKWRIMRGVNWNDDREVGE
ncbi:uncharacterized protein Z518_03324 [Rhinocladiella mackenziei CBS 650.93]|uniref:Major facilitator superfamily (MFS) profile domain-containing protein n=1 Tax=Rhinocladiella mackenziei CBS 650.93 TaxID=1442369 RepID=A0A0D2G2B4_9EURO|nr:uncharacterized protein Z518_03324 [Rhinocladiella mackenziei CBS 650.93]KIX08667.1 hypothetical protein Z518_03324 [Rhinocladiella mackenziei CBS 650.93]